MRHTSLLTIPLTLSLAAAQQPAINITNSENVNQASRVGDLAYGATNLAFGYSAGAGINFSNDTVGGGFNAGIPGQSEGSLGGGWTLTGDNLTFGFGGVYNGVSINIAIFGDKNNGSVSLQVNGKDVAL